MAVLRDMIQAMPLSRGDYISNIIKHAYHIVSHLVKAVEFREYNSTREWLAQAENALLSVFNTPTDKRLKESDFKEVYKKLSINDDNARYILKGEINAWFLKNKSLTLSKTTTRAIADAVNEILYEQCKLAYRFRFELHTQVPVGTLTDSMFSLSIINTFEKLEHKVLFKKNPAEIERLLHKIEQDGAVD